MACNIEFILTGGKSVFAYNVSESQRNVYVGDFISHERNGYVSIRNSTNMETSYVRRDAIIGVQVRG